VNYAINLSWTDGAPISIDLHNYLGENIIRDGSVMLQRKLHKDLEPVQDKITWETLPRTTLSNTLLTVPFDKIITVTVTLDGSPYFKGYLRPTMDFVVADDSTISFEALDNSWRIAKQLGPNMAGTSSYSTGVLVIRGRNRNGNTLFADEQYYNHKVCDPSNTSNSIVHKLLAAAGYSSAEYSGLPTISNVISFFSEPANDRTIGEILEELLFSYGYVYYFDESGVFKIYNWMAEDATPTATVNNSSILSDPGLNVKRKTDSNDGVEVKWYSIETTPDKQVIVHRNTGQSEMGSYPFPADESVSHPIAFAEGGLLDGRNDIKVLGFSSAELDYGYIKRYTLSGLGTYVYRQVNKSLDGNALYTAPTNNAYVDFSVGVLSADIQFKQAPATAYPDAPNGAIAWYTVRAITTYRVENPAIKTNESATKSLKVGGGVIYDLTSARRLATALHRRVTDSLYEISFDSQQEYSLGQYITVNSPDLNATLTARITEVNFNSADQPVDGTLVYSYVAESVTEIGALIGVISGFNLAIVPTRDQSAAATAAANAGLTPSGSVLKTIEGYVLDESWQPLQDGLYLSHDYLGYYDKDGEEWTARIKNDGTFRFGGIGDNKVEWDGSDLTVKGAASIDGTITAGDGIQSSDYVAGSAGWRIDGDGTAEFDAANIRGTISATTGAIGGWDVTATALEATDDSVSIRSDLRRVEVRDAVDVTKVALGYLSSIADYDATDFGLYVGPGASVGFSSGAAFEDGDYLINSDAAFIAESGGIESVRLGSLGSGDIGLDIGGMKFGPVLGGGGATGTFESIVSGGGGATGTFDPVSGGGGALYGTDAGLLYSLADDRLYITGTLVAADGEFSGTVRAGTFIGGTIEGATITGRSEISVIDDAGDGTQRSITIGNDSGILAQDASGNITHDILDKELSSELRYMGHYYALLPNGSIEPEVLYFRKAEGSLFTGYDEDTVYTISIPSLNISNVKGIKCSFWYKYINYSSSISQPIFVFRDGDGGSDLDYEITGDIRVEAIAPIGGDALGSVFVDIPAQSGNIKFFYTKDISNSFVEGRLEVVGVYI
jgi:hypothetical protein